MAEDTGNEPGAWPPPGGNQPGPEGPSGSQWGPPQQPQAPQPPQWQQPAPTQPMPTQPAQWGDPTQPQRDPHRPWLADDGTRLEVADPFASAGANVEQGSVRKGLPLGRLGLIATIVALAGLGGFAVWRALDDPGGAATPEEAAAQVFDAAETEDLLGVIESMLPSERESMVEPFTDVMIELARLDVLSDEAVEGDRLNSLAGFTVDFPDDGEPGALVYDVEPVGTSETIRWVTVTDGDMTVTLDPVELRDGLGERIGEWIDAEITEADMEIQTETVDLGDEYANGDPLQFAVVEEGGSWYFSVWYTVAGFANDFQAPDLTLAMSPIGAGSPEGAASQFLENLIELDMSGAMALLDPEEFRAAYDYWGEFGPQLADEAAGLRRDAEFEGLQWDVRSISASSEGRNGRTVATIDELTIGLVSTAIDFDLDLAVGLGPDGLGIDGTVQGEPIDITIDRERATGQGSIEGQPFEFDVGLLTYEGYAQLGPDRFDLVREGDCLVVTVNNEETETVCGDEFGADPSVAFDLQEDYEKFIDDVGTPGLTVVERDGQWYVAGFPTYAYAVVDFLKAVEPEELDELFDSYEDLIQGLADSDY